MWRLPTHVLVLWVVLWIHDCVATDPISKTTSDVKRVLQHVAKISKSNTSNGSRARKKPKVTPTKVKPTAKPSTNISAAVANEDKYLREAAEATVTGGKGGQEASHEVVRSWVFLHVAADQGVHFRSASSKGSVLVSRALSDALFTCRPAVSITRAESELVATANPSWLHMSSSHGRRAGKSNEMVRDGGGAHADFVVELMKIRLEYEVSIFPAMHHNVSQLKYGIDALFTLAGFENLRSLIVAELALHLTPSVRYFGLDDIGRAQVFLIPPNSSARRLTMREIADCREEELLRKAHRYHKFAMMAALVMCGLVMASCLATLSAYKLGVPNERFNDLRTFSALLTGNGR